MPDAPRSRCVPFLKAGVESKEVFGWVLSEPLTEEEAKEALRQTVPALDQHLVDRRIEIIQSRAWYLTGDTPDLRKTERGWEAMLSCARTRWPRVARPMWHVLIHLSW